jgi:hypothetical protein
VCLQLCTTTSKISWIDVCFPSPGVSCWRAVLLICTLSLARIGVYKLWIPDFSVYSCPWVHSFILFFFAVLGLELRPYTLSHSTKPFFLWWVFLIKGLANCLPGLTSNYSPSSSLPTELLGLQDWASGSWLHSFMLSNTYWSPHMWDIVLIVVMWQRTMSLLWETHLTGCDSQSASASVLAIKRST